MAICTRVTRLRHQMKKKTIPLNAIQADSSSATFSTEIKILNIYFSLTLQLYDLALRQIVSCVGLRYSESTLCRVANLYPSDALVLKCHVFVA